MQLITLTTDFGTNDYYVAAVKGAIYKKIQNVQIVDVSHDIQPFTPSIAAIQLKCLLQEFPEGTIHLVGVKSEPNLIEKKWLPHILQIGGQYIIAPDNGFFGELLNNAPCDNLYCYDGILQQPEAWTFALLKCYVDLAKNIVEGKALTSFCRKVETYEMMLTSPPKFTEFSIIGKIIYIDKMGNTIINITKQLFDDVGKGAKFELYAGVNGIGFKPLTDVISRNYFDGEDGNPIAIFNSNGLLEIAICNGTESRGGGVSSLFGLRISQAVEIKFFPPGSRSNINELFT